MPQSIATIKGDLSNITAPPFVLADKSTTELPRYWISQPDLFCAPTTKSTPEERMLAVLKWFLASLQSQQYAGRDPSEGVKKPLNAFLGELFIGSCGPEDNPTTLVSEQVSHHPPVTACYLVNEKAGVRAEGYTRQEITFSGSVHIQQIGHAILHLDKYDEDYLIPLPDVTVKGILSAGPYPELSDHVAIVSSTGLVAEIDFTGKKMLGFKGQKNHVDGSIHKLSDEKRKEPLYTATGSWSEAFTLSDSNGKEIETYNVSAAQPSPFRTPDISKQDPWESRRAWSKVISSINEGNMKGVADAKDELENAQRELRKQDQYSEEKWRAVFFRKEEGDARAEKLLGMIGETLEGASTVGCWRFGGDVDKVEEGRERGFREGVTPFGAK